MIANSLIIVGTPLKLMRLKPVRLCLSLLTDMTAQITISPKVGETHRDSTHPADGTVFSDLKMSGSTDKSSNDFRVRLGVQARP